MMQYPLTIEQFQYPEFEKGIGKEFITAFINAINNVYEKGRRVKNSGLSFAGLHWLSHWPGISSWRQHYF